MTLVYLLKRLYLLTVQYCYKKYLHTTAQFFFCFFFNLMQVFLFLVLKLLLHLKGRFMDCVVHLYNDTYGILVYSILHQQTQTNLLMQIYP